ncbi:hypothetical protein HWV62_35881 [Athelia sp. TMB]|nr:hypothetical protein HWV62_35881 [Athelia sp. TMB]
MDVQVSATQKSTAKTPAAAPNARPASTLNPATAAPLLVEAGAVLLVVEEPAALVEAEERDDTTDDPADATEEDSDDATDDAADAPDECGAVAVVEETGPPGVIELRALALALEAALEITLRKTMVSGVIEKRADHRKRT